MKEESKGAADSASVAAYASTPCRFPQSSLTYQSKAPAPVSAYPLLLTLKHDQGKIIRLQKARKGQRHDRVALIISLLVPSTDYACSSGTSSAAPPTPTATPGPSMNRSASDSSVEIVEENGANGNLPEEPPKEETPEEKLARAERTKEAGNVAFKAKRYDEALKLYSEAVGMYFPASHTFDR
jgi:hypothetical protein